MFAHRLENAAGARNEKNERLERQVEGELGLDSKTKRAAIFENFTAPDDDEERQTLNDLDPRTDTHADKVARRETSLILRPMLEHHRCAEGPLLVDRDDGASDETVGRGKLRARRRDCTLTNPGEALERNRQHHSIDRSQRQPKQLSILEGN